ncbi:ABC transporter substrate-binding protein [Bosea sp. SSUT16]|uniref:ABC transporter substrate-binding protein n=1 Tax=Bosea spartocytisi TaxID=2773451 RepID=A0A927E725_9HYPH|nr:ABC transporter substrate-binding protein [Bosea spartocytisi]MBD3844505.1 ABC transporter substrate-binding protein [Bosea spartocytisi]MCT4470388.1 ABC transporter substrate-binding protein [Bosea spartocytisi]
MTRFHFTTLSAMALAAAVVVSPQRPAFAQGQVTVYCSILEEQCREGAAMFEKATGIKVAMIRKSTGEVYAQVKAEANNPRGDVWWGGPGEPHLQAAEEGLLDEYKSPKLPELHDWAQRHAEQSKFRTNAIYLGALGIGYNSDILKKRGIAAPKCWADLLDATFRDEVQIADPSSSGTAYVFLATTVQRLGEEKGFEFLKSLHKNISQYTKSGIAPVKATALGETAVGIAFIHDMLTQKLQGAPIETVAPCEGTGYETGSVSVVKGGKNPEAARKFVDFTLSPDAQNINAKLKINSIPSNRNALLSPDAPKFSEIKLIDYDTPRWGSPAERSRLLKKFDAEIKTLPR